MLRDWLPQIAQALDFIHRQGYVHRDLKPGNIMFGAEGHPCLTDFGIVKVVSDVEERSGRHTLTPVEANGSDAPFSPDSDPPSAATRTSRFDLATTSPKHSLLRASRFV